VAVDVLNDAGGRERLLALGVRTVPVVARGSQYVFGQNIDDVAEFVGMQGGAHTPLSPDRLIAKWLDVYRAAQRHIRQLPEERLHERVIASRDRSIRILAHHVFRIGEAFLETVVEGAEFTAQAANVPPEEGTFTRGEEIARYGDRVLVRLSRWGAALADRSCKEKVKTFFGMQPIHGLLERSTWHSAQHARQLAAVLERFGIEPDGRLTAEDLDGLPLPKGLWE
jgi:hypothetical protein